MISHSSSNCTKHQIMFLGIRIWNTTPPVTSKCVVQQECQMLRLQGSSTQPRWNNDRRKLKYLGGGNLFQHHSIHHKSHMD